MCSFRLANEECIAYLIKEYSPLLDSTNMTFDNYIHIALDIKVIGELFKKEKKTNRIFISGSLLFIRWICQ